MEEWKKIPGWEKYSVSTFGRVRNDATGRYMTLVSERGDYKKVTLSQKGKSKRMAVHRAVCMAFIPNPDKKETVNHKNGIHSDNRVENLEWMTQRENNQHKYDVLGFRMTGAGRKSIAEKRMKMVKRIEDGKLYTSMSEAASDVNISLSTISMCVHGNYKTAGGYHWELCDGGIQ